jgi:predicted amidohydrolase
VRGNISHNLNIIQRLIDESKGDLAVLPEYALTGSLVLDPNANVHVWAARSRDAKGRIDLPEGKNLLLNALHEENGRLWNCCELMPTGEKQFKLFPDETELRYGIMPGTEQRVFSLAGKRFKVIICSDIRRMNTISTDSLDFIVFVYHFTHENFKRVTDELKAVSRERLLPIVVSSLVSDKNAGFSSLVNGQTIASIPDKEGILEIEL